MKIVVIGDIHGSHIWKGILKKEDIKTIGKVIFLGDYFDDWDIPMAEQAYNFGEIVGLKMKYPEKVELLIGNHDYHYMDGVDPQERYSGFQADKKIEIRNILTKAKEHLKFAYGKDGILFTHAGVSKVWMHYQFDTDYLDKPPESLAHMINGLDLRAFEFTPNKLSDQDGSSSTQTPIWIRPPYLVAHTLPDIVQVVGHTHMHGIMYMNNCWFADGLRWKQYLVIEESEAFIVKHL